MKCIACPMKHIQLHDCPYPCTIADSQVTWQMKRVEPISDDATPFYEKIFGPPLGGYRVRVDPPERKGWVCPKCENVVSPDEKVCPVCRKKKQDEQSDDDGQRTYIQE